MSGSAESLEELQNSSAPDLLDLLDFSMLQETQDAFAKATGVASIITQVDGTPITEPSNFCRLCSEIIRKSPKGLANCIQSDSIIGRPNQDGPVIQPCLSGGLWDAGASIYVDGRHIANWLIGQVRDSNLDMERMLAYAREIGIDESFYKEALEEVPVMSKEQFTQVAQALFLISSQLSSLAHRNYQLASQSERLEGMVAERTKELRESEERYRNLFYTNQSIKLLIDPDTGRIKDANAAAYDFYGYEKEKLLALNIKDINILTSEEVQAELKRADKEERNHFFFRHRLANGEVRDVEVYSAPSHVGGKSELLSIIHDITERIQAEERLRLSELWLKRVFNSLDEAVLVVTPDRKLVSVNNVTETMFGYSQDELKSLSTEVLHVDHEHYVEFGRRIKEAFDKGISAEFEFEVRRRNGEVFPSEHSVSLLKDDLGKPLGILSVIRDITERKRMENALLAKENKYRETISATQEGYWLIDEKKETTDVNDSFCRMIGYEREELLGKSPLEFVDEENGKIFREQIKNIESSSHRSYEITLIRKDGSPLQTLFHATTLKDDDGKIVGAFAFVSDISSQKEKEEELINARVEAEEATKLKDKFVNLVAHDLRSPFSSILGMMNLLSNDPDVNFTKEQRKLLDTIIKSGDHMVTMIDEMLDISRLKTGKITLKPTFFDAHLLSGATLGAIRFKADEKGIVTVNEVPEGSRVYADPTLLAEVLSNLVANAMKFCGKGDAITLFIPPDRPDCIAVKDTGTGIDEEILNDLFKSEIKTTTPGLMGERGTGLGLPYSYEIMRAHGGDLYVESEKGRGSVFYIVLSSVRPRVLLVDDEKIIRKLLERFLDPLGVDILEADNGRSALGAVAENAPHLIICDITMPVMDGFALLKELKGSERTNSIPIIVVTSDDTLETREKVIRMGADDFIAKPIREEEIIPRIRKIIV